MYVKACTVRFVSFHKNNPNILDTNFIGEQTNCASLTDNPNISLQSEIKNTMVNCAQCSRQVKKDQYYCLTLTK